MINEPGGKNSKARAGSDPASEGYNRSFVYLLAGVGALGGPLFGYDTGVISGALLFLRDQFHLSPTMQGTVTSAVLLDAVIGAAASGTLADRLGRCTMLIVAAVLFGIGGSSQSMHRPKAGQ